MAAGLKVLIFGAGAVGSVMGGFLARMGHAVSLLGRPKHLDVIETQGLTITGIWGNYRIKAFELYRSVDEIYKLKPNFDLIFLTVKSYDTLKAAQELAPLVQANTTVISLQNGLGNIEAVLTSIRPEQFLAGRIITGIELSPGMVNITVTAAPVEIGALPGTQPLQTAVDVAHTLALAKIPCVATNTILSVIWAKVIYNCALNAPCALLEKPYGAMLETPERIEEMRRIVSECYAVAKAKNILLEPDSAEAYMDVLIQKLIPPTAAHYPSMLRDIQNHRRTEIDSLNGAIARYASELRVPAPENQKLTEAIRNQLC